MMFSFAVKKLCHVLNTTASVPPHVILPCAVTFLSKESTVGVLAKAARCFKVVAWSDLCFLAFCATEAFVSSVISSSISSTSVSFLFSAFFSFLATGTSDGFIDS